MSRNKSKIELFTRAYFYFLTLLLAGFGMAFVGKFITIEPFTLSQLTGVVVVLSSFLPLWMADKLRKGELK